MLSVLLFTPWRNFSVQLFSILRIKNPQSHFVLQYSSFSYRRLKSKHRFIDANSLFASILCVYWPSLIGVTYKIRRLNDFLSGGWTTISWRDYHQTFSAKTSCYRTCKFILFFIYSKDALNPNLLNRQIMPYLQMTDMSSFL